MKPLDVNKQLAAVEAIKESLRQIGEAEDLQLLADSIEGETGFFEVVDALLEEVAADEAMADSIDAQIAKLKIRKDRVAKRCDTTRAVLEQAYLAADLPKIERPIATVFLSNRAPKLVVETESDIPAKFWKPSDPTLDKKALGEELKDRRKALEAILKADKEACAAAVDAFCQRFLDDVGAAQLRTDLPACFDPDEAVRTRARETLLVNYASVPGASLLDATPTLSIRMA